MQARGLFCRVAKELPPERLAMHFHDTRGQALANILACLERGLSVVDASVGGFGGCPYAPGAGGNVTTEELVNMLEGMGVATGVDLDRLMAVERYISGRLGHVSASRLARAGSTPRAGHAPP
jgi:hydroxymethylglutaryl-CoA lyase